MFLAGQALASVEERGHFTVCPGEAFLGRWHLHVGAKKGSCGYLQEAQWGRGRHNRCTGPEQTPCIQEAEGRLEEQKQSWGKETKRT